MDLHVNSRHTARYTLRPFRKRDAEALLEAVRHSMPDLYPFLPWATHGYNQANATRFIRNTTRAWREQRAFNFAIRDAEGAGPHLGNVSVLYVSKDSRTGEIGYWINSGNTGQGTAAEVTARIVQVAFEELGLHRVVLRIAVGNRPSERVAEKLGFTREGVLREELEVHGTWLDHTAYSMLEHEYMSAEDDIAALVEYQSKAI